MYGEDIDICYRLKKAGYYNFYFPQAIIIHFKGESTQKRAPSYGKHFYGAMHLFVRKHYSRPKAFLMHGAIRAGQILSRLKYRVIKKAIFKEVSVLRTVIVSSAGRFGEVEKILDRKSVV